MDIIIVSNQRGRTWRVRLDPRHVGGWLPVALVLGVLVSGVFAAGYSLRGDGSVLPETLVANWAQEVGVQRAALAEARRAAEENANALARRIARLQAHVIRLDAAGQRLTEVAGLDGGEFDFHSAPAVGGPETSLVAAEAGALDEVLASLDDFERRLSDRERQLRVLEDLLLASRLQKEVRPSGWPVETGWISSDFGRRTDPFTGRLAQHLGIDFAGRAGAAVLAVATGIVTDAGDRTGYGKLVEINHGNGYITRYGHNRDVLVKVGDKINKGQRIARVGSSGRSTGPHVHFEVLFNGKPVNPALYIEAAR